MIRTALLELVHAWLSAPALAIARFEDTRPAPLRAADRNRIRRKLEAWRQLHAPSVAHRIGHDPHGIPPYLRAVGAVTLAPPDPSYVPQYVRGGFMARQAE